MCYGQTIPKSKSAVSKVNRFLFCLEGMVIVIKVPSDHVLDDYPFLNNPTNARWV